jgi:hypothetical protein
MNRGQWRMQVMGWVDYRVSRTRRISHSLFISMVSRGVARGKGVGRNGYQGVGRSGNHEHRDEESKGVRAQERQVITRRRTCGTVNPFPIPNDISTETIPNFSRTHRRRSRGGRRVSEYPFIVGVHWHLAYKLSRG